MSNCEIVQTPTGIRTIRPAIRNIDTISYILTQSTMSATTQVSSGVDLGAPAGPTLTLTGAGEQKPTRTLTRDEAVGFEVDSPDTWTDFHKRVHKLKPQGDYDVDMKILACGVCGSDVHTLCGGWGDQHYPLCVGHG